MIKICSYCGHIDLDSEERCECGGEFIYDKGCMEFYSCERDEVMAEYEEDLLYGDNNNIDNILEWKRSKRNVVCK